MKDNWYDVIIVGAGPVGNYTAYLLSKKGLDVGLFERNSEIGKNINCTGIISDKCYKKLGIEKSILVNSIHSIKAFSPSGNTVSYYSNEPIAYTIDRKKFDIYLNNKANQEGVRTYLNANVKKVLVDSNSFKIHVDINGEHLEFNSKIGVIATGYNIDSVYKVNFKGNYSYGIQTTGIVKDIKDVEIYFGNSFAPGSFGWVTPYKDSEVMIGIIVNKNPKRFFKNFIEYPLISNRIKVNENGTKCSLLPIGMNFKTYDNRVLIVGEAAGQIKSTTGGGIYFGIICSEIAVKTILKSFGMSDFSTKVLREYQLLWRKEIGPELKAGKILREIFSRLSDRQIDILVDIASKDGVMPVIEKTDFDWHRDAIFYIIKNIISKGLSKI